MSRSGLSRWFTGSLFVGLGLLALAFGWIVFKAMRSPKRPAEPLWTEAALPSPPVKAENGFALLGHQLKTLGRLDIPPALTGIGAPTTGGSEDATWSSMQVPEVDAFLQSPDTVAQFSGFERSLTMPRFAEDCPLDYWADCPMHVVLRMHRTMELRAARTAARGDWTAALVWANQLVRADTDFVTNAREIVAHAIGIIALQRSVELSAVFAWRLEADGVCARPDAAARQALDALRNTLLAVDPARIDLRKAVISGYIAERKLLLKTFAESTSLREKVLLDPADTLRRHDARFRKIEMFAASPLTASPPMATPQPLPWTEVANNPIGKQMLAYMELDVTSTFQDFERKRLEAAKRRDGLVKVMEACLQK